MTLKYTANTNSVNVTRNVHASLTELLAGGFFIVLPILLIGMLAVKSFHWVQDALQPLLEALPGTVFRNPSVRFVVVCITIAALFICIGLLARTLICQALGRWLETRFLNHMPFYSLLRNVASGLAGKDEETALRPVLVTVDVPGLQQLGFIIEHHADGYATVFLPSTPTVGSGTVVIVEPARMRELHVSGSKVLSCLSHWGDGAAALLEKAGGGERVGGGQFPVGSKDK